MNSLTYWGLALGVFAFALYICVALKQRKEPDLSRAANILMAVVGAAGAVRLIGFVFTDGFGKAVAAAGNDSLWALSGEDVVFLALGGLALAWVSCQTIWQGFSELF